MKHLYWLDHLETADRALVGEKAWNLGQLQQQGYPVLPGYVIPPQPLQDWLEQHSDFRGSNLSAADLEFNDYRSLQRVAQDYRQALLSATLPEAALDAWMSAAESWQAPALMVRASLSLPAEVALDVTGLFPAQVCWPCPAALAKALKQAWGNLFCARNLLFWQKAGLDPSQLRLALLVQPCQAAIASGRVLWRNGKVWLQAVPGLGHSLVRGEVLPDCYQFDPVTGNLEARQVGNQSLAYHLRTDRGGHCLEAHWLPETPLAPILEENWLEALLSLCQRLGKSPLKRLEWTLSVLPTPGKLYLTQAIFQFLGRRTVDSAAAPTNPASPLLRGLGASPGIARAPAHILSGAAQHLQTIPAGCILVARHLTPDWLP
ncbi:MAG: hypothetical protein HC890_19875 [Chloroflexaceae bacterium]|nr:hypothetical protein [Chloroflexaceae bacterium]